MIPWHLKQAATYFFVIFFLQIGGIFSRMLTLLGILKLDLVTSKPRTCSSLRKLEQVMYTIEELLESLRVSRFFIFSYKLLLLTLEKFKTQKYLIKFYSIKLSCFAKLSSLNLLQIYGANLNYILTYKNPAVHLQESRYSYTNILSQAILYRDVTIRSTNKEKQTAQLWMISCEQNGICGIWPISDGLRKMV